MASPPLYKLSKQVFRDLKLNTLLVCAPLTQCVTGNTHIEDGFDRDRPNRVQPQRTEAPRVLNTGYASPASLLSNTLLTLKLDFCFPPQLSFWVSRDLFPRTSQRGCTEEESQNAPVHPLSSACTNGGDWDDGVRLDFLVKSASYAAV